MASTPHPVSQPTSPTQGGQFVDERVLDARLATVEARTETSFAKLIGKLDLLGERLGQIGKDVTELKGSVSTLDGKTNNIEGMRMCLMVPD